MISLPSPDSDGQNGAGIVLRSYRVVKRKRVLTGWHSAVDYAPVLLSDPEADFTGGEFVLVEQRPRAQSSAHVVPLARGEAVIFTTRYRPARGARGWYRVALRHSVSEIRSGDGYTLGVIFHDAE